MSDQTVKVLLIEDNDNHAVLVTSLLGQIDPATLQLSVERAPSVAAALSLLGKSRYDVCLLDYKLDDADGLQLLRQVRSDGIDMPVIMLTSMGDEEVAVEAMKSGAKDYIRKDNLTAELLAASVRYALEARENERLRQQAREALERANETLEAKVAERTAELRGAYSELQRADRLRNEMIQNISHEFRTPLGYIVGYVDLLLDTDPERGMGPLLEAQQRSLEIVAQQAHKLTRLLENFVLIQMLDTMTMAREAVDVEELLTESVQSAGLQAEEREIKLAVEQPGDLPRVMVDRFAMGQVLDNLLANAFKFTDKGGKVSVRAWRDESGEKVKVSVADTGIGIEEGMHERIFDRFYQIDGTLTRHFGGVGLGLAVCKEIIEAHGEEITVESEVGKGATFTFTMAVAE